MLGKFGKLIYYIIYDLKELIIKCIQNIDDGEQLIEFCPYNYSCQFIQYIDCCQGKI